MSLLALTVAISTLFGWVPWPAEFVPAAQWISVAALLCIPAGPIGRWIDAWARP